MRKLERWKGESVSRSADGPVASPSSNLAESRLLAQIAFDSWTMNWKGFGRKRWWPNRGSMHTFSEMTEETHKKLPK
jgi:hypothetical protein